KLYNDTNKHDNELELLEQQINKIETAYNNLRNSLKKQLPTEQFEILKRKTQEIYDAEIFLRRRNVDITADRDTKQALNIKNNFDSGNIDSEYSKIESSLRSLNTVSKTTEENLNKLSQSYIALKNAIDTNNTKEIIKTYNQFEDALKKVNNELKQAAQLQKINESVYNLENSKKQFSNEINVWLSQNSSATKKFGLRIKTIQSQLESCNETSLDRLKDEFRDITQEATIAGKTGLNFIDTLKQKGKELASYYTISGSFYKIVDTAKQAYQNVANVDSAMTNLYKVTDNTDAEYSDFFQNAKQNAKDLGVTLTDYITATSEWSKLGYDINASSQLAKVSSIYQNVGEVDSETAVKDIVTALKAYNINVDDAISIVDKFNKLGNEFAVSSSSLGEGLKVSASSLAVAGNDINKSLAMLTGGGEITQDIGELGNGLKTISLRLRGMKGELQDIGEEYEDIESVSKIQTQIYNLTEGHT
ncbi:MAG: phage tail tape measure protein, partial [Pseudoruminococcus massiliensis]